MCGRAQTTFPQVGLTAVSSCSRGIFGLVWGEVLSLELIERLLWSDSRLGNTALLLLGIECRFSEIKISDEIDQQEHHFGKLKETLFLIFYLLFKQKYMS